ncbi:hypothetical protein RchiOBHm_Chr4g0417761 [Rosa chinensis]|uniref:Uncharacterized protein n=1 Tax=Rosa chinensis TaxID=74649 RepID=A0A2P6QX69_ROSCH|nr:hypothetical protein RchiOBHm_Chr4g0417761 [Rosa chinensis]
MLSHHEQYTSQAFLQTILYALISPSMETKPLHHSVVTDWLLHNLYHTNPCSRSWPVQITTLSKPMNPGVVSLLAYSFGYYPLSIIIQRP